MTQMQATGVILAKKPMDSSSVAGEETLVGHSRRTAEVFTIMFGIEGKPTRLCLKWLQFFKIEGRSDEFLGTMPAVCYLHDMGKANSGFQQAVTGRPGFQVLRHEHLSGLLLWFPDVRHLIESWHLKSKIVVSAVIGHHLKAKYEEFPQRSNSDLQSFNVYSAGINELLAALGKKLGTAGFPEVAIPERWSFASDAGRFNPEGLISELKKEFHLFSRELRDDPADYRLLMAMRTALIVADSAASGLLREGKNIQEWINASFDEAQLLDGEAIEKKVIEPRVTQLRNARGGFQWKDFQQGADQLPERALMLASCGSGKTLAAWRWIKARAAQRPVARVIFLYPTRGTATEGFRDYVSWAPEADAALVHGTSAFELDGMFENPQDPRAGKEFLTEDRLFSLGYWQRRIFSATVDQFLGFMQHVYRSTCLMPLLADSVVVIDEMHSFDHNLFSALKRFLQTFDVPVLCMTASLPSIRQQDLQECGLTVFPSNKEQFSDLQIEAAMPRYQVRSLENEESASEIALNALKDGRRVLWVVNTVPRCQRLARQVSAMCYHSRFRLEDRKRHHNRVVAAFQPDKDAILAITTQVCEMSLDLDADVLITETAPITSLIQRMGRCNRHARPGQNKLGAVYFYAPQGEKPYSRDEFSGAANFLGDITDRKVSQDHLEELLAEYGPRDQEVERYSSYLDSGPWAMAREETLREEQEFTVQAVLDSDIERYLQMRQQHKPIDGLIVPVPRRFARSDPRVRNLYVAPASNYDPEYGFLDNPVEV